MKQWIISLSAFFLFPGMPTLYGCGESDDKNTDCCRIKELFLAPEHLNFFARSLRGDKKAQSFLFRFFQRHKDKIEKIKSDRNHFYYSLIYNGIGLCYKNGWGCPKDEVKAVEFFKTAIRRDIRNWESCFNLAVMHYKGKGKLKPNPVTAKMLFSRGLKPDLAFLFEALSELKKGKQSFVLWLSQAKINNSFFYGKLPQAFIDRCFETFTSFLDHRENQFCHLIIKGGLELAGPSIKMCPVIAIMKRSLALIDEGGSKKQEK